jgi:hypothetical protein
MNSIQSLRFATLLALAASSASAAVSVVDGTMTVSAPVGYIPPRARPEGVFS